MRKAAILCGVALLFGLSLPAKAQQPFEDVPKDHWAYQAVNTLQERGVVIGYPDGTFGGKRAMTRYEFAVAIQRLLVNIIDKIPTGGTGGLTQADVDRMLQDYVKKSDLPDFNDFVRKSDLPDFNDFVKRSDLSNFVTREDLQNIQRLVDEFRDELASLGTDVQAVRRDLDMLKTRVSALEDRMNKWKMSGEATAIFRGDRFGKNGALGARVGTDLDSRTDLNTASGSILESARFLYDLNLGITGRPVKGVQANALFNYGNYLPWVSANRAPAGYAISGFPGAAPAPGTAGLLNLGNFGSDGLRGTAQITPLKLNIAARMGNLGPVKDVEATLGKFGEQFTPYTLKQVDPDSYTYVPYTDNGEVIMTGAKADAHIGKLMLTGYAAKHENFVPLGTLAFNGYGYAMGITAGGPPVLSPIGGLYGLGWDQSAGGRATIDLGRLRIGGTYLEGGITKVAGVAPTAVLPGDPAGIVGPVAKRGQVYGGDVSFDVLHNLRVDAEFASSNTLGDFSLGGQTFTREGIYPADRRNAYDGKLSYGLGRLSLAAGFKQVDPFFGAPGFWGAIGRWKNPTNIRGINGQIGYNFGERLSLEGQAEFYNSLMTMAPDGSLTSNGPSNGIQHFQFGVKYALTSANRVDLGWEQGRYRPAGSSLSIENYYNIGFGHDFNDNTSLKLLYQIIDYHAGSTSVFGTPSYKGGVAVGQVSVKF